MEQELLNPSRTSEFTPVFVGRVGVADLFIVLSYYVSLRS